MKWLYKLLKQFGDDLMAAGKDAIECEKNGGTYSWGKCTYPDEPTKPIDPVEPIDPIDTPYVDKPCIAEHDGAVKSILYCGNDPTYALPKGDYNIRHGRFTAKIKGIGDVDTPQAAGIAVVHGLNQNGNPQNFHLLIFKQQWRLSYVRWPESGGVEKHNRWTHHDFKSDHEYTFDCSWNDRVINCTLYDNGVKVNTHSRALASPFDKLTFGGTTGFRFGHRAVRRFDFGRNPTLKGVRFSTL